MINLQRQKLDGQNNDRWKRRKGKKCTGLFVNMNERRLKSREIAPEAKEK